MTVDVKKAKAVKASPPPLSKGRKGSQIPVELLEGMKSTIEAGDFASIDTEFESREKATSAMGRFRKALATLLPKDTQLTGRIWGDTREADENGNEIHAKPFHFALADKAQQ